MFRILTRLLAIVFCLFLVLAAIGIGILQTNHVRRSIFEWAVERLDSKEGILLQAEEITGFLPFTLEAHNVRLVEQGQAWVEADTLKLHCAPLALLWRTVNLTYVTLEGAKLRQRNPTPPENIRKPDPTRSRWTVNIDEFVIHPLELTDDLVTFFQSDAIRERWKGGKALDVKGKAFLNLLERDFFVEASLIPMTSSETKSQVTFYSRQPADILSVRLYLEEGPEGMISSLVKFPGHSDFELSVTGAAPLSSWLHLFKGSGVNTDTPVTGDIRLTLTPDIAYRTLLYRSIFFNTLTFHTSYTWTTTQDISLHEALFKGRFFSIRGPIELTRDFSIRSARLEGAFDLAEFEYEDTHPLHGNIDMKISATGTLTNPSWDVRFFSDEITAADHHITDLQSHWHIDATDNGYSGSFKSAAEIDAVAVKSNAHFDWAGADSIQFNDINIVTGRTNVSGALKLLMPSGILTGSMQGSVDELRWLSRYLQYPIRGSLDMAATFYPDIVPDTKQVVQGIKVQAKSDALLIGRAFTKQLAIDAVLSHLSQPHGEIKATARSVKIQDWQWDEMTAKTTWDASSEHWSYEIETVSKDPTQATLHSAGWWRPHLSSVMLQVNTLNASLFSRRITLQEPFTATFGTTRHSVTPVQITVDYDDQPDQPQGIVYVAFLWKDEKVDAILDLHNVSLDLLREFDPSLPRTGQLSTRLVLKGDASNVKGTFTLSIADLQFFEEGEAAAAPPLFVNVDGYLIDDVLSFQGHVREPRGELAHIQSSVPLTYTPAGHRLLSYDFEKPFEAQFRLHGDIAPFWSMFVADTHRLTGHADLSVAVAGTLEAPIIQGHAELKDATYENLLTGSILRNISLDIEGHDAQVVIKSLSATDGRSGHLHATGTLEIDQKQGFPFHFIVQADKARLLQLDYAQAEVNGNLTLVGNIEGATLAGQLTVARANVVIPEELPVLVPVLPVTYINGTPDLFTPKRPPPRVNEIPVALDITVEAPGHVQVSGRGLASVWRGKVNVTGTAQDPRLYGDLTIINGTYTFARREFHITRGVLSILGKSKHDTMLTVAGDYQQDSTKIIAMFVGPISNPKLTFASNPPLPEREILSLLLFNKHVSEVSPLEGIMLGRALYCLNSDGSNADPLGTVGSTVGLDRLDISTISTEGTNCLALQAGKYLSDNILVAVARGITADANLFTIEAKLARYLKLIAQATDSVEGSKILLQWRRDY